MIIAVDFDGTIVEHDYPRIGREKPFAIDTLRALVADGHRLILWTAREGDHLEEAVEFCRKRGVVFYAVNSDVPAGSLFAGRMKQMAKVKADIYIDDRNLGGLPDWGTIYTMISSGESVPKRRHRRRGLRHFFHSLFR